MRKPLSGIAIIAFVVLFLISNSVSFAAVDEQGHTTYSAIGVTPKNYKKLPVNKIILKWPKMKGAKFYLIDVEKIDLNTGELSGALLVLINKNKIDIHNDDFGSAVVFKQNTDKLYLTVDRKKIMTDFFQRGYKYGWVVSGLDSKVDLYPEHLEVEESAHFALVFQTLQKHTVGKFKKPLSFFTEPKAFLGTILTPVSDELLKEVPEIIKDQLKSGEGEMIVNFSDIAQPPVIKNSPAEKAGLQAGDVILEIDGKQINKDLRVTTALDLKNPGDVVNVKIWRAEKDTMDAEKFVNKVFYKKIKLTKKPYKYPIY